MILSILQDQTLDFFFFPLINMVKKYPIDCCTFYRSAGFYYQNNYYWLLARPKWRGSMRIYIRGDHNLEVYIV